MKARRVGVKGVEGEEGTRMVTIGDVLRRIKRPRHWFLYHVEVGHLPDAAQRITGRRVFSPEEVDRIEDLARRLNDKDAPASGGCAAK